MTWKILLAGFGGQGILFAGKVLAYAGMIEGLEVSWLPSYGPEMRGGTANCHVILSDKPIGSPIIIEPDVLVVMNGPSLAKFEGKVRVGGHIVMDSSLISRQVARDDVSQVAVPATKLAGELGIGRLANLVMLGKMAKEVGALSMETLEKALAKCVSADKKDLLEMNVKAARVGNEN